MSKTRRIYVCSPCSTDEQKEAWRESVEKISERIRNRGWNPVVSKIGRPLYKRLEDVAGCDGIILDTGWKKCPICLDEYCIAQNHKLTFYHTREEWDLISDLYVL